MFNLYSKQQNNSTLQTAREKQVSQLLAKRDKYLKIIREEYDQMRFKASDAELANMRKLITQLNNIEHRFNLNQK